MIKTKNKTVSDKQTTRMHRQVHRKTREGQNNTMPKNLMQKMKLIPRKKKQNQCRKTRVLSVAMKKKERVAQHQTERLNATKMRGKESWRKTRKIWLSTNQKLRTIPHTLFPTNILYLDDSKLCLSAYFSRRPSASPMYYCFPAIMYNIIT